MRFLSTKPLHRRRWEVWSLRSGLIRQPQPSTQRMCFPAQTPAQRRFWERPPKGIEHDPRGCLNYVHEYIEPFESELRHLHASRSLASPSSITMENGNPEEELALGGGSNDRNVVDYSYKRHLPHPNIVHPPTEAEVQRHLGKTLNAAAKREEAGQEEAASSTSRSDSGLSCAGLEQRSPVTLQARDDEDQSNPLAEYGWTSTSSSGATSSTSARGGIDARLQAEAGPTATTRAATATLPDHAAVLRRTSPPHAFSPVTTFSVQKLLTPDPEIITSV